MLAITGLFLIYKKTKQKIPENSKQKEAPAFRKGPPASCGQTDRKLSLVCVRIKDMPRNPHP